MCKSDDRSLRTDKDRLTYRDVMPSRSILPLVGLVVSTSVTAATFGIAGAHAASHTQVVRPTPIPTVASPRITYDPIPFSHTRQRQMTRYAKRHYGINSSALTRPRVIVLHFTVSDSYRPVWNYFASNQPAPGPAGSRAERPGGCTQFVIDKNGRIYQLTSLHQMCRHTIGLNHVAIGIEFVEMNNAANILQRPRQLAAGRKLVRWLQGKFQIRTTDVVGHGTANRSRYFKDLRGWRNDHVDWNQRQVTRFSQGIWRG